MIMDVPRPRPLLDEIPAYRAGRSVDDDTFKLSSNENPYPPLPSVVDATADALARMNRYPDAGNHALYDALGDRFGLPESCFAVGPGSVSVLYDVLRAVCDPGDEVIVPWRSFEAYPLAIRLAGAEQVSVPLLPDGRHDLAAMLDEVTVSTKVVLVCSPNNPTGPAVRADEFTEFLAALPDRILVVLDEAYAEFVRADDAVRGLQVFATYHNVVVLRTFSKAYGLAGLRVGFMLAPDQIAAGVRKVTPPFAVTSVASAAAVASLAAMEELRERVDSVVAERSRVLDALRQSGWTVPDAQANFVWLDLGDSAVPFSIAALDAGLAVRPFAGEGVRVTIGAPEANDRFLELASDFERRSPTSAGR